jgi:hypothetical protein
MNWNTDEVMAGLAIGAIGGAALGWELRKIVERFQRMRAAHKRDVERINAPKRNRKNTDERDVVNAAERDREYFEKRKRDLGIIPLEPRRSRRNTPANNSSEIHGWPENPDRDDVIAALMGSGYSKTEAVKAADACSMVERAHGLEAWTRAAFNNAHRSKS